MSSPTPDGTDAIRADIEATRAELAATVDQLSQRLDVPARARETVARAKDTAVETYRESPPAVISAGAVAAGLLGLLVVGAFRQRRRRRRAEKALAPVGARHTAEAVRIRSAATGRRRGGRRNR